jgi:hypothetical protein
MYKPLSLSFLLSARAVAAVFTTLSAIELNITFPQFLGQIHAQNTKYKSEYKCNKKKIKSNYPAEKLKALSILSKTPKQKELRNRNRNRNSNGSR